MRVPDAYRGLPTRRTQVSVYDISFDEKETVRPAPPYKNPRAQTQAFWFYNTQHNVLRN